MCCRKYLKMLLLFSFSFYCELKPGFSIVRCPAQYCYTPYQYIMKGFSNHQNTWASYVRRECAFLCVLMFMCSCTATVSPQFCLLTALCRLWWTPWWVPYPPSWMCCLCASSSGSSSASWVSTCLPGNTITASTRRPKSTFCRMTSTIKLSALSWLTAITLRSGGKTWRSILTMWVRDILHFCKW